MASAPATHAGIMGKRMTNHRRRPRRSSKAPGRAAGGAEPGAINPAVPHARRRAASKLRVAGLSRRARAQDVGEIHGCDLNLPICGLPTLRTTVPDLADHLGRGLPTLEQTFDATDEERLAVLPRVVELMVHDQNSTSY